MHLSNSLISDPQALFGKKASYWLSLFCIALLFIPKINVVGLGGRETAGIRVDDIVLLGFSLLFFWARFAVRRSFFPVERALFAVVGFALISYFSNRFLVTVGLLHVNASIFYAVRLFEYFLFFYIGMMAEPYFRISTIFKAFLVWNGLIILLQQAGLVGAFTVHGYLPVVASRFPGTSSFPSEMGLLLNMVYSFIVFDPSVKWSPLWRLLPAEIARAAKSSMIYWLLFIVGILIVLTGSRIALAALALVFFFRLKNEIDFRSPGKLALTALFVMAGTLLFNYMITITLSIYQRSAGLLAYDNIELIRMVWEQIDTHYDPIGNEIVGRSGDGNATLYDASWWMRIHKWGYALKIYVEHPECWLQGVGPGFAMAGLDGGFLRIFTEYGIIGSILFWRLFALLWRQSEIMKWVVVAIFVNMIFFDVYLAYKPMSLLFLLAGYGQICQRMSSSSRSTCFSRV